jgi:prevent-host-death family protein
MRINNIISLTEARKRFFDIAEETQEIGNHFVFTLHGKPIAVAMGAKEHEKLQKAVGGKKK